MSVTIATPKYNLGEFPDVYEPAEDSYLLLDALEKELPFIQASKPCLAAEIGAGSGIVITALCKQLNSFSSSSCMCFAIDINIKACKATLKTAELNLSAGNLQVCNSNLFQGFKENVFDLVLFNPPYVVTEDVELQGSGLNRAWAGGSKNGRLIIDQFLNSLPKVLSENGFAYLLALKENDVEDIKNFVKKLGFNTSLVVERKIPGEHLFVLKFTRE